MLKPKLAHTVTSATQSMAVSPLPRKAELPGIKGRKECSHSSTCASGPSSGSNMMPHVVQTTVVPRMLGRKKMARNRLLNLMSAFTSSAAMSATT